MQIYPDECIKQMLIGGAREAARDTFDKHSHSETHAIDVNLIIIKWILRVQCVCVCVCDGSMRSWLVLRQSHFRVQTAQVKKPSLKGEFTT